MPRIEQNNSMPISLHYALTDSQCNTCGGQLEWQADFDTINQPKYVSQHCNQDYAIHIETVKVVVSGLTSKDRQKQEQEKSIESMKQDEPKALKMAEGMKRQQQQQNEEER
jgi:membrane protein insertase Oxa1/YidC/SpoIIIJ